MKTFKILIAVFLIALLFTGCSERNDLSELSIVEGMGIDYVDDEISVTVQTLNLSKEGSGAEALSGNVTMNTEGRGSNISGAIENATEKLSKKIFFGQNRIIVFGMSMAESYIDKNIDYLLRSSDSRSDVKICIADGEASKVMESKENNSLVPSESITSLLAMGEESGFGASVTTNELLNMYLDKTSDIYLPVVKAEKESVSVSGIAVYNKQRLVAVLDENETFGLLMLRNKINTGFLEVKNSELGEIGVDIIKSKTKTSASYENGRVVFRAKIKADLMLDAVEKGHITTLTNKHLQDIQKLVENEMIEYCSRAFTECVKGESDCLRVGESLAMCSPKAYDILSDNWKEAFSDAVLEIEAKCRFKKINENSKGD